MTAQRRRVPDEGPANEAEMVFRVYRGLEKIRRRKRGEDDATTGHRRFKFALNVLRQREIERIIESRHGRWLPEVDGDEFFIAIARALQVDKTRRADVLTALRHWCARWAPWALKEEYAVTLFEVANSVRDRTRDLKADAVARLLRVQMAERVALRLKTVGACDVSRARRDEIMKEIKREADRDDQRRKRRAKGSKLRADWEADSLAQQRPWEAQGISRRTWYRRRGTGPSRAEDISITICDTPVPTATTVEEKHPAAPADEKSSHQGGKVSANLEPFTSRVAQRNEAGGVTYSADLDAKRLLYRRFLHPAPPDFIGSTTEVRQAA